MTTERILRAYNFNPAECIIESFGSGLINHTWKLSSTTSQDVYIVQRINTNVFRQPENIAANIKNIADYLHRNNPDYLFIAPLKTVTGTEMYVDEEGYFRVFPFLKNSHSVDVVNTPSEAFEAAQQFGMFTRLLSNFNVNSLGITILDFHNLSLRFQQFKEAIKNGNKERIKKAEKAIEDLLEHASIAEVFAAIKINPEFKVRVMHHDTKISNVLFNAENKGACVIDLDTVMPGYFISDVGDMMRTYLSPVTEEESDFDKIKVREEYFKAISDGYLSKMKDELSQTEKAHFVYAGKFLIYMQALRFLTDYLNNDAYYGSKYEGHNLVRAENQIVLLQRYIEKEPILQRIVQDAVSANQLQK
jgi:hypothetical protein